MLRFQMKPLNPLLIMQPYKEHTLSESSVRKRTLYSFIVFFVLSAAAIFSWIWLHRQTTDNGALKPLRMVLNANEGFFNNFFSNDHLAKTYPVNAAVHHPRVNGSDGMSADFDTATWKLHWVKQPGDTVLIGLAEIKAMPKTEIIFDFKCIEGWSQVTRWGGVKFSDFAEKYGMGNIGSIKYGSLVTPDSGYYVGIDLPSLLHPQTMLCYEVNGEPLPLNQGYPLRLIIPVKYGIKNLKRIGIISFSADRPADFWYERGYDYYSGL